MTLPKAVQPLNAESQIYLVAIGTTKLARERQSLNVFSEITATPFVDGSVKLRMLLQPSKADGPISLIREFSVKDTDCSAEHR